MAEILRDEYLRRLESFRDRPDLVKILTGVRRSGKSTILSQFRRRLEASGEEVVSVDMEAMSFVLTTGRDLYDYLKERMPSPDCAVLLDEVQYVDGWERAINALRAGGADVYVTGSNAKVLSSEFSTMLAGRYAEIHVLPFSFREFLERYPTHGDVRTYARFEQYLRYGGLPIIDLDDDPGKNRVIMSGVYDSVVGRDIASRAGVELRTVERMTSSCTLTWGTSPHCLPSPPGPAYRTGAPRTGTCRRSWTPTHSIVPIPTTWLGSAS